MKNHSLQSEKSAQIQICELIEETFYWLRIKKFINK